MATQQFSIKNHPKAHDLTGKTFSRLTVLAFAGCHGRQKLPYWQCKCVCGNECIIRAHALRTGNTQSCGCLLEESRQRKRGPRVVYDIIGKRFGRWVVMSYASYKGSHQYCHCKCDCGNEKDVSVISLIRDLTLSCGCLSKEVASKLMRKEEGRYAFNIVLRNYKSGARMRKLSYSLTEAQFKEIIVQPCFYCGRQGDNISKTTNGSFAYTGIDRLDNTKGYEIGNIVPCCIECNKFKGPLSFEEFIAKMSTILFRVENHLSKISVTEDDAFRMDIAPTNGGAYA